MPFHICGDEILMLMAALPFIGAFFRRIHAWYHVKFKHKDHSAHERHKASWESWSSENVKQELKPWKENES
jgi:hypothetical protein